MSFRDFAQQESHRHRGVSAEEDGVAWLRDNGYEILDRNVQSRYGEIDVVARQEETLCFVEIKARTSTRLGSPLEAVTTAKQRRLTRCAEAYLMGNRHAGPCRFDVLAMLPEEGGEGAGWRFELVRDAFPAQR